MGADFRPADPGQLGLYINWKAQTLPVTIVGRVSKGKVRALGFPGEWGALPEPTLEEIR